MNWIYDKTSLKIFFLVLQSKKYLSIRFRKFGATSCNISMSFSVSNLQLHNLQLRSHRLHLISSFLQIDVKSRDRVSTSTSNQRGPFSKWLGQISLNSNIEGPFFQYLPHAGAHNGDSSTANLDSTGVPAAMADLPSAPESNAPPRETNYPRDRIVSHDNTILFLSSVFGVHCGEESSWNCGQRWVVVAIIKAMTGSSVSWTTLLN